MKKGLLGTVIGIAAGVVAVVWGGNKIATEVGGVLPHKEKDMVSIPEQEPPHVEGEIVE